MISRLEPPSSMSAIRLIGTCYTCVRFACLQPKHAEQFPDQGCREGWTNGEVIQDIDEHWPCPECDEIIFIETASHHQCGEAA